MTREKVVSLIKKAAADDVQFKAVFETLSKKQSILELAKWTKEHADFLVFFQNYDEEKVNLIIRNLYMPMMHSLSDMYRKTKNEEIFGDALVFSVKTVLEIEKCNWKRGNKKMKQTKEHLAHVLIALTNEQFDSHYEYYRRHKKYCRLTKAQLLEEIKKYK